MRYSGIGVSPGVSVGHIVKKAIQKEPEKKAVTNVDKEINRLRLARAKYQKYIDELIAKSTSDDEKGNIEILESYKTFADDDYFFEDIEQRIQDEKLNAEWALKIGINAYIEILRNVDDEYIGQRAVDIKDIGTRISNKLMGVEDIDLSNLSSETIFLARELTPSEIVQMNRNNVNGVISEIGGKTSHVAIIARTKEIPAVMGIKGIYDSISDGDTVILDGAQGVVIVGPTDEEIAEYMFKIQKAKKEKEIYSQYKGSDTYTSDNRRIELAANIGLLDDVAAVLENDAEGVGLFRTEFIFMDRKSAPSEDEQFRIYKTVAQKLDGKPVIIRTLDIGGDKPLEYLKMSDEENPFLGYRAIRICLEDTGLFKSQLKAILRASFYGNLKIMFPMISGAEEIRAAKMVLDEAKAELHEQAVEFKQDIDVGIMIEIPSAAVISDILAKEVDFFSIGTNDLVQYTLAVDRGNEKVSTLYNHFHPAVLRLIKTVIDNAHNAGIWAGICGESANDPAMAILLAAMGIDELSVNPTSVLRTRWLLKYINITNLKEILAVVINMQTPQEVEEYLMQFVPKIK